MSRTLAPPENDGMIDSDDIVEIVPPRRHFQLLVIHIHFQSLILVATNLAFPARLYCLKRKGGLLK